MTACPRTKKAINYADANHFYSVLYRWIKYPLHRAVTLMPHLSDQRIDRGAQWSPKPRKFSFCVTAAAWPLCVHWTTKIAIVAQQVVQRRLGGGRTISMVAQGLPWSRKGGTVVATVITQWTLIGRLKEAQWWYKGGRSIAQIHTMRIFLRGGQWLTPVHPFCDHDDACAFLLPPLNDPWATDLLGDLFATVWNMLKTSRRPWRPWRGLNVLCATHDQGDLSDSSGPSAATWSILWSHKGGTNVSLSPCVKGVLVQDCSNWLHC